MKISFALLVAASLIGQQSAPAQPAAGVIAGVLTAADSGQPVRKAQVKLINTASRLTRMTTSDGDGRFTFATLPTGDYTLSASKPGFLDAIFGARRPGPAGPGMPIHVAQGQKIEDVALRIVRGGVIGGNVFDEFGDPSFNTMVRALRFVYVEGEPTLTPAGQATTDDLGGYRIAGLLPGEYVVSAIPRETVALASALVESQYARQAEVIASARARGDQAMLDRIESSRQQGTGPQMPNSEGYAPSYHPGTFAPSAAGTVRVVAGQDAAGVNIRLQVVRTATVSGVVVGPEGSPIGGANLQLIDPTMPIANINVWFRTSNPDGRFSFHGVAPGTYVLRGQSNQPASGGHLTAAASLVADAQATGGVELRLQRGVVVSGRLAMETLSGSPVTAARLRVELVPILTSADWERAPAQATPDTMGRFSVRAEPGRYRVTVTGLPAGWTLASALFGQLDAADHHLTIERDGTYAGGVLKFTNRSTEISGVVTTAMGAPSRDHTIVVFSEDRGFWIPRSRRIQLAAADANGRYTFRNLPPGDYRLATVLDPEPGREFDPEFLGQLATVSTAITLADGEKRTQDLRVR